MTTIDRRALLRGLAGGLAASAVGGVGLLASGPLNAAPLPIDARLPLLTDDLVLKTQAGAINRRHPHRHHHHHHRPRRRRWVCWWHGRRRVCGWRWV